MTAKCRGNGKEIIRDWMDTSDRRLVGRAPTAEGNFASGKIAASEDRTPPMRLVRGCYWPDSIFDVAKIRRGQGKFS